jgi:type IV secretory pathway TrbF-like protein
MAAGLGLQLVALGLFFTPRRPLKPSPIAHAVSRMLDFRGASPQVVRPIYSSWTYQAELARRQRAAWRFAATASMALCMGLAAALTMTITRPAVALHVIEQAKRGVAELAD